MPINTLKQIKVIPPEYFSCSNIPINLLPIFIRIALNGVHQKKGSPLFSTIPPL